MDIKVQSLDELDFYVKRATGEGVPLLLQFGNVKCVRCPEFSEAIKALKQEFHFLHAYCDTFDTDDLLEEYGVTKVPSILIAKSHIKTRYLNIDTDSLKKAVEENCKPVLSLDADF